MGAINPVWLVLGSLVFAAVPIALGLFSSYLKVNVVLGMLRSGLGAQNVPSNMLIMALSLALTAYIMAPVAEKSIALLPNFDNKLLNRAPGGELMKILSPAFEPWREFMQKHTGEREIAALVLIGTEQGGEGSTIDPNSLRVLIPAFVLTEMKEAFAMGFVVLLPFLAIDLIVANLLTAMGMTMLSPTMISLPLKLLLLVATDGWLLLCRGLIGSYL